MRVTPAGVRDAAITTVALGVIVHQTAVAAEPSAILIAGALALLGVPSALFADRRWKTPPAPPPAGGPDSSTPL